MAAVHLPASHTFAKFLPVLTLFMLGMKFIELLCVLFVSLLEFYVRLGLWVNVPVTIIFLYGR